jgi:general secretion pathway protein L
VRIAVHSLALPAGAQKQLAEVLPFELEAALPVDMAESVFDYRLLAAPPGGADPAAQIGVLAAVARTEDVKARIELVKEAMGAEPERIGAGALPLSNLVGVIPMLAEPGPVIVVDLGTRTSEVLVLVNGEPTFARTASWGTQGLPGTAPKLARELRVTIGAFRAQGGAVPSRVVLCGGGAFVSGAQSFLAGELDMAVEILPAPALDLALLAPERLEELPRYAKAIGLALGLTGRAAGLDLRRGPLSYERGFAWIREKVPVLAGLGAVIVVSFLFSAWAQLYAANKDRDTYTAALTTVTGEVLGEQITDPAQAQEKLSQMSGGADDDPMPHVDAFDVMVKLSDIPPDLTHDIEELDVQKQHATVHGIAATVNDAQSVKSLLEQKACFSDVKISRFNQQVGGERQKYVLDLDLRCPEDGGKKKKPASSSTSSDSSGGL